MGLNLCIPPCVCQPRSQLHPPLLEKPLRVEVMGTPRSIKQLLNVWGWKCDVETMYNGHLPQPFALRLAWDAYKAIYGTNPGSQSSGDMVFRAESCGTFTSNPKGSVPANMANNLPEFDYYSVVFDHRVYLSGADVEVMLFYILDFQSHSDSIFSPNQSLPGAYVDEPTGKVIAIPDCCHLRDIENNHRVMTKLIVEGAEEKIQRWSIRNEWDRWVRCSYDDMLETGET